MKNLVILLVAVILCANSCKSDSQTVQELALPTFWYDGCSNFVENESGYKHEGRCCEWVSIPKFDLKRNQKFTVEGKYNRYTQYSKEDVFDRPITISGQLSQDGKTLELDYEVDAEHMHYEMKTDDALALCNCICYFK